MLTRTVIWQILSAAAAAQGIDPLLVGAIAMTESSWDPKATRFEQRWNYFYDPARIAADVRISEERERREQATSWGLMQIMGACCREQGFRGILADVGADPALGARLACAHLAVLLRHYDTQADAVAAYNAGTPRRIEQGPQQGNYVNQTYVDRVWRFKAQLAADPVTAA